MSYTPVSGSDRLIDQVLAEAGLEEADDLRPVLHELRSLGTEQPEPSAEILALMEGTTPAGSGLHAGTPGFGSADGGGADVVDLAARRRNKRRLPLTVLGVAAALAVGGGAAAAADQGVRDTLHSAFTSIASTFGSGNHKQGHKNPTVPEPTETGGDFQGTSPSPAGTAPATSGTNGRPGDGTHPRQDGGQAPGDPGTAPGRSSENPWPNGTTPAIPNVPAAPSIPAPALTPSLPSLPALPPSERTDGATPQP